MQTMEINGELYSKVGSSETAGVAQAMIGKYALVRSRNEGINAGIVIMADGTGVYLKDARRLWYHKPASKASWYEGVARDGLCDESKCSIARNKVIVEDYSIVECSDVARKSIEEAKDHEQS